MLLKRKRSDSEISFSSGGGFHSSPARPGSTIMAMDLDLDRARSLTPSHLPSRTLKRFRDNRPSDQEVHRKFYEWRAHHAAETVKDAFSRASVNPEHTMQLLYSAAQRTSSQQHPQHQSAFPQQQPPAPFQHSQQLLQLQEGIVPTAPAAAQPQRSLHSFWNLPSSAPSSAASTPPVCADGPSCCEDCGAGLGAGNATGMDMDLDGGAGSMCGACGKAVCFSCSVSNLGEQRRCLVCAGRKVWIGGIGWTAGSDSGVGVC